MSEVERERVVEELLGEVTWDELDEEAARELGPLAARVRQVPRYRDTPQRMWGRGAFEGTPGDVCPEAELEAAARALAAARHVPPRDARAPALPTSRRCACT